MDKEVLHVCNVNIQYASLYDLMCMIDEKANVCVVGFMKVIASPFCALDHDIF